MLKHPLHHICNNAVAYVALFVALGGTGYSALSVPDGSVGGRQLRNHSVDPVKFNPRYINGSVRAWAEVNADGRVIAGRGGPRVTVGRGSSAGRYLVRWNSAPFARCLPIAGVDGSSRLLGFAQAQVNSGRVAQILVEVFDATQRPAPLPFYSFVIC